MIHWYYVCDKCGVKGIAAKNTLYPNTRPSNPKGWERINIGVTWKDLCVDCAAKLKEVLGE